MEPTRQNINSPSGFDMQVGALLDRIHDTASIVDRLMDMPLPQAESDTPEWDLAVARRLEARLARSLRDLLEGEPERRRA